MPEDSPLFWSVEDLQAAYRRRDLSPVEVTEEAFERIGALDARLRSYLTLTPELAKEQAEAATRAYADGEPSGVLLGVPTAVKDLFDVEGVRTTLGSLAYRDNRAKADSAVVGSLRAAGAIFLGKTNTAEFGQSATTENLLALGCANPWDEMRTSGGSSGGSAAAVGAGLASIALGSDGGGSIRIPAAFTGLFGIKPTYGGTEAGATFQAMTEFACPGPLVRRVADARALLSPILGMPFPRRRTGRLRIAWCARPLGLPVDPGVDAVTTRAVAQLADLGHDVVEVELPIDDWNEAFGPLVLADEWAHRRQLLETHEDELTRYAKTAIQASVQVGRDEVERAREALRGLRSRVSAMFADFDLIVTPATAATAFPIGERPRIIDGRPVGSLWGAFPFTAPFNVAGTPAASLPCGLVDGLPVGLQVIGPAKCESRILDLCEDLEEVLGFPGEEMSARWGSGRAAESGHVVGDRDGPVAILRISRPDKRGALSLELLDRLDAALRSELVSTAATLVLTGESDIFSAGADLGQTGRGLEDLEIDRAVGRIADGLRALPSPVIAAVEGPCMGAAVELAMACDVVVSGDAGRFSLPSTKLGILYRPAALRSLSARLGHQTLSRLVLIGEVLDAETAAAAGMVAKVVEAGGAYAAAVELARQAGAAKRDALAATKAVLAKAEASVDGNALPEEEEMRRNLLIERGRLAGLDEPVDVTLGGS